MADAPSEPPTYNQDQLNQIVASILPGWTPDKDPVQYFQQATAAAAAQGAADASTQVSVLPEGKHIVAKNDALSMKIWVFSVLVIFAVLFGVLVTHYGAPWVSRRF